MFGVTILSITLTFGYAGLIMLLLILWKHYKQIYIIIKNLRRDIRFFYRFMMVQLTLRAYSRNNATILKIFRDRAHRYPNKTCLIGEDRVWTNAEINAYSNKIASVFQKAGYKKGDVVALMMTNKPEFVATWLGLGKIGVISAFININLRHKMLAHCLDVAKGKGLIYSNEFSSVINNIAEWTQGMEMYKECDKSEFPCEDGVFNLNKLMLDASAEEPIVNEEPKFHDRLLYIYTSGTTGLPKAALIRHSRTLLVEALTYNIMGLRPNDIMYNANPLYHLSGGIIGICCALTKGIPSVVRRKFSVTNYWSDCVEHKCTVAMYIGEMCRYLLSAPNRPEETTHSLRLMIGNGLKLPVWRKFVDRFKIKEITECYGSSEGNVFLLNIANKIGAIGFMPLLLPKKLQTTVIVRVDPDTYEPIRGPDGLCIEAKPNEEGMCIGMIREQNALRQFDGYLDKEATMKKILRDVLVKGDKAFITGDILMQDEEGYYYFRDRIGDTFRWKGENIATTEVEGIISAISNQRDVIVYGVEIPGTEGKAGMAGITDPDGTLDLSLLAKDIDEALPSYARPIFLRIVKQIELTGTYKLRKVNFEKESYDPTKIEDKLYFRSNKDKDYIEITPKIYEEIMSGERKF